MSITMIGNASAQISAYGESAVGFWTEKANRLIASWIHLGKWNLHSDAMEALFRRGTIKRFPAPAGNLFSFPPPRSEYRNVGAY